MRIFGASPVGAAGEAAGGALPNGALVSGGLQNRKIIEMFGLAFRLFPFRIRL